MALYTEYAGAGFREPLGGREADGFGQWLATTTQTVTEAAESLRERFPLANPMRYVAIEAARHYGRISGEWRNVTGGRDVKARHRFEVDLIAEVMGTYGALQFARRRGYGHHDVTAGGRPMEDVSAAHLRACIILAKYVGIDDATVAACRDDQAALMSLRNTRTDV